MNIIYMVKLNKSFSYRVRKYRARKSRGGSRVRRSRARRSRARKSRVRRSRARKSRVRRSRVRRSRGESRGGGFLSSLKNSGSNIVTKISGEVSNFPTTEAKDTLQNIDIKHMPSKSFMNKLSNFEASLPKTDNVTSSDANDVAGATGVSGADNIEVIHSHNLGANGVLHPHSIGSTTNTVQLR